MAEKKRCEGCGRYAYYVTDKRGQELCGNCCRRGPRKKRRDNIKGKVLAAWFFIE